MGMSTKEVQEMLLNGKRMQRPADLPDELYEKVIQQCWQEDPYSRPNFKQLFNEIITIAKSTNLLMSDAGATQTFKEMLYYS